MAEPSAVEVGPGTVLASTYRLERLIGRGGMGHVWEASHLRVPKRVAVKVLQASADAELVARFRQEAEIASRLGHPNIVDVLDFDTLPSGVAYLVMELLAGENLATRLAAGPLAEPAALAIVRQIASALAAAHDAGVVHRDLKPENVFLVPREHDGAMIDEVKVLDFGISKVKGSTIVRTREDVVMGTPKYMAPEQATGSHDEIGPATDQFALAVMAYEMLAGRAPFDGDNETQVMYRIVHDEASPLGELCDASKSCIAAIERAMAKSPAQRFRDVSAFVAALTGKPLATDRGHGPTLRSGSQPTVADSPAARSRRAPARRWIVLAGAAVLAFAATWLVIAMRPSHEVATRPAIDAPLATEPPDAVVVATLTPDAAPVDAPPIDAAPADTRPPQLDRPERVPAAARADLDEAERALREGRLDDAEHAARRVLYHGDIPAAYIVLTAIACARHDLSAAKAEMRRLRGSAAVTARARCHRLGFDLE